SEAMEKSFASAEVLEFYKELPFNYRGSAKEHAAAVRRTKVAQAYPVLAPLLGKETRVLDVGCGVGWLVNAIAYRHKCRGTGIDFNPKVIQRAKEFAAILHLDTEFIFEDLFRYTPAEPFDLVVSIGVLHHTKNASAGLRHLSRKCVKPGGHLFVGLYHEYGRKPFLEHFKELKENGLTEEELFREYQRLHSSLSSEYHAYSWFRDQVLHPLETRHTLAGLMPVFREEGMELISTSINRFSPYTDLDGLFELERSLEQEGIRAIDQGRYYPGFFVVLTRKYES
ncbi:MAG: class I SAM-dependent methyltransferase, partial [Candidatus Glassbacteria bacterium]|nr:class I SAM-dependent methyltransferase [Candidatus Glassbacteria bacterium]